MLPHYLPGWPQTTGSVSKLDYFQYWNHVVYSCVWFTHKIYYGLKAILSPKLDFYIVFLRPSSLSSRLHISKKKSPDLLAYLFLSRLLFISSLHKSNFKTFDCHVFQGFYQEEYFQRNKKVLFK